MKYQSKNNYLDTSGFKAFIKDLIYSLRYLLLYIKTGGHVKTLLCYPEFPAWSSNLHHFMFYLDIHMTSCIDVKFDYAIGWKDITFRETDDKLKAIAEKVNVININCNDISKEKVEECFKDVFGYSSFIDPYTYKGKAVEKINLNGRHEQSSIINCPIKNTRPGFVYQKLLKTSEDDTYFIDYRLLIVDIEIPIVYKRYKNLKNIFHEVNDYEQWSVNELFTDDEIQKIMEVCRLIGLDFGEIDCVRDTDNRLYIIDINNTPQRPPNNIRKKHYVKYEFEAMKVPFYELLEKSKTINWDSKYLRQHQSIT